MASAGLNVAVLQCEGCPGDTAGNLALLERHAREAAAAGDELLVTSELFLTGFFIGSRARDLACAGAGPELRAVRDLARRYGLSLLVGYPERDGDAVYNAAAVAGANGEWLGNYRKQRLSGAFETATFQSGGGEDLLFTLNGISLGVLICYDLEFPENVRRLALAGARAVLAPTALSAEFAFVAEKLVPTRAFENGVFMVYGDRCGQEHGKAYAGLSCIVAPDGSDLARAGGQDELIRARIDPGRYAALAERLPYLRDLGRG